MTVSDVWADVKEVFGSCNESTLYRRLNSAIDILVDKGDWNPLYTYLDLCAPGRCVALPSDVETVLAAICDGVPALPRSELYRYHINGPGERVSTTRFEWENGGLVPTMRDLVAPVPLVAHVDNAADTNCRLVVYGFDEWGHQVRTQLPDSTLMDGYLVPTIAGWPLAEKGAPRFSRITGVRKAVTQGVVRLSTADWNPGTNEGALLGTYQPYEVEPAYRRIRLSKEAGHVRLYVRRRTYHVHAQTDFIPLHHAFALRLGMQAVQAYVDRDPGLAMEFESNAVRLLADREAAVTPPGGVEFQFDPGMAAIENLEDI